MYWLSTMSDLQVRHTGTVGCFSALYVTWPKSRSVFRVSTTGLFFILEALGGQGVNLLPGSLRLLPNLVPCECKNEVSSPIGFVIWETLTSFRRLVFLSTLPAASSNPPPWQTESSSHFDFDIPISASLLCFTLWYLRAQATSLVLLR